MLASRPQCRRAHTGRFFRCSRRREQAEKRALLKVNQILLCDAVRTHINLDFSHLNLQDQWIFIYITESDMPRIDCAIKKKTKTNKKSLTNLIGQPEASLMEGRSSERQLLLRQWPHHRDDFYRLCIIGKGSSPLFITGEQTGFSD